MSLPGLTCASSAYPRHPAVKTKLRLFVVVASGRTEKQRIFSREPFFLTPAQVRLTNMLPAKCLLKSHSFRFFLGQFSGLVSRQGNLRRPSSCVLSYYVRILPGYRVPYPGTSGPQLVFFTFPISGTNAKEKGQQGERLACQESARGRQNGEDFHARCQQECWPGKRCVN